MSGASPTELSLKRLRADGYLCEVVERWNPHTRTRHDLFGIIDIIAIRPGETLAVQTTSASGISARIRKIADSPTIANIREAGWSFHVHGWAKNGHRWQVRIEDVS